MRIKHLLVALLLLGAMIGSVFHALAQADSSGRNGGSSWESAYLASKQYVGSLPADNATKALIGEVISAASAGTLDALIAEYAASAAEAPQSAPAHFALGYALLVRSDLRYSALIKEKVIKSGYEARALRELAKATELDTDFREAILVLGGHQAIADPVKGVAILQDWLKRNPKDAWAMYWLAMAYGVYSPDNPDQSRYCHDEEKALEWYEKAAKTQPNVLRFRRALAFAYLCKGLDKNAPANSLKLTEPWRTKAIAEFEAVRKLAKETEDTDSEALAIRILTRVRAE